MGRTDLSRRRQHRRAQGGPCLHGPRRRRAGRQSRRRRRPRPGRPRGTRRTARSARTSPADASGGVQCGALRALQLEPEAPRVRALAPEARAAPRRGRGAVGWSPRPAAPGRAPGPGSRSSPAKRSRSPSVDRAPWAGEPLTVVAPIPSGSRTRLPHVVRRTGTPDARRRRAPPAPRRRGSRRCAACPARRPARSPSNGRPDAWHSRRRTVEPGGPGRLVELDDLLLRGDEHRGGREQLGDRGQREGPGRVAGAWRGGRLRFVQPAARSGARPGRPGCRGRRSTVSLNRTR